jgi:magnesium transporter
MLLLTFIAGVYGMNLPLWPPPEHPLSFWGVVLAMMAIAAVLLVYFRRRKWL